MRRLLSVAVLLAAVTFPVLADERMEHAEWISEFRDGTGEASTKDGGMARFGILCNEDSCRFYYENGVDCEPGNNYPVVIATSAGSIAVETVCVPVAGATGEVRRYGFAELSQFNEALMQSDSIGIAFPLSSGQFKISQFLMNGYGEATERVLAGMRARKAEREAREAAERERQAREAAERARKAQEAAERARQAAEQAAERARKVAEQEAVERARKVAEQEAVERARKVAEQEAAERARKAAEQEAAVRARLAAEQEAAARARAAAEQEAAERALKAQEAVSHEVAPAVVETRKINDSPAAPVPEAVTDTQSSAKPAEIDPTADMSAEQPVDAATPIKPETTESTRGKRLPAQF